MEVRINSSLLVPPSDCLGNMLRVSAEVTIKFVVEIRFRRGRKCWQIVENVVSGRRTLKKRSFGIKVKRMDKILHMEGGGGLFECSSTSMNA